MTFIILYWLVKKRKIKKKRKFLLKISYRQILVFFFRKSKPNDLEIRDMYCILLSNFYTIVFVGMNPFAWAKNFENLVRSFSFIKKI